VPVEFGAAPAAGEAGPEAGLGAPPSSAPSPRPKAGFDMRVTL